MNNIYERLSILEEMAKKIQRALNSVWPVEGGIMLYNFEINFYKDDDGERVGVVIEFDDNFDITPNIKFFNLIQSVVGAEDIYLTVEDGIVTSMELYFLRRTGVD